METATLSLNHFTRCLPFSKNPSSFKPPSSELSSSSSSPYLSISNSIPSRPPLRSATCRPPNPPLQNEWTAEDQQRHQLQRKTLLVEAFHRNNKLKDLLWLLSRKGSSPLRLLERDGDWNQEELWAVLRFLKETGRMKEILQVFNFWKNKEVSRINVVNYSRIIRLLCETCLMEEAISTFQDMDKYGLAPSLAIYNNIIHGFARKKEFDNARATFSKMVEAGFLPTPETYNGLIRAYGIYGMYDEMCKCVKRMESEGFSPDEVTYNILIVVFGRGGLLERMEGAYQTLLSKRMNLQSSTMVTMLEAYADLGVLEKMECVYRRVLNSTAFMKENLIRKLAVVYIENHRFSRLEEFGNEIASRTGRTDLVWCILLLSCVCLLSRKGVESVIRGMELAEVRFSVTFTNILALFYMKVRDFRALDAVFARAAVESVEPDIVTVGILFDACRIGYDGTHVLVVWRRRGSLKVVVEMKTDPLALVAFGKGVFIRNCEDMYSSLDSKAKEKKHWMYSDLISLVFGKRQNKGSAIAS